MATSLGSFLLLLAFSLPSTLVSYSDPDLFADVRSIVESRGFPLEEHFVTTADGYILTVHRIRSPRLARLRRPVILQHGLLCTSREFMINAPGGFIYESTSVVGNNMAFELAKHGYDVWLPNSRGNTYSRNHTTLDPSRDKEFWNFSFDEMVRYDAPAVVDYVIAVTRRLTVGFIGHSQGTTILFGLLASRPEYNDVLKPCIALAPITVVGHSVTPYSYLAYVPFLVKLIDKYGGPFLPSNRLMKLIASRLCTSCLKKICSNAVFMANGFNEEQMNLTRLGVYASGFPAGTSARNMVHFAQAVLSRRFARFDYGDRNMQVYGSREAPEYPLENITSRHIIVFLSQNDWLSNPRDTDILVQRLRVPLHKRFTIPVKSWNHLDFLLAKQAGRHVNRPILAILEKYNKFR